MYVCLFYQVEYTHVKNKLNNHNKNQSLEPYPKRRKTNDNKYVGLHNATKKRQEKKMQYKIRYFNSNSNSLNWLKNGFLI